MAVPQGEAWICVWEDPALPGCLGTALRDVLSCCAPAPPLPAELGWVAAVGLWSPGPAGTEEPRMDRNLWVCAWGQWPCRGPNGQCLWDVGQRQGMFVDSMG